MSELRNKMKTELDLRGYSPTTIKNYIENVSRFAKHFNQSPELLGEDQIREYLHYCIMEKHLSEGTVNYINGSLKFFYTKILKRNWNTDMFPRMKEGKKLPVVLSKSEVKAILDVTDNLKHKAILTTIYGAGLRISEAARLKGLDIDSNNMQIVIRQGKGKKIDIHYSQKLILICFVIIGKGISLETICFLVKIQLTIYQFVPFRKHLINL